MSSIKRAASAAASSGWDSRPAGAATASPAARASSSRRGKPSSAGTKIAASRRIVGACGTVERSSHAHAPAKRARDGWARAEWARPQQHELPLGLLGELAQKRAQERPVGLPPLDHDDLALRRRLNAGRRRAARARSCRGTARPPPPRSPGSWRAGRRGGRAGARGGRGRAGTRGARPRRTSRRSARLHRVARGTRGSAGPARSRGRCRTSRSRARSARFARTPTGTPICGCARDRDGRSERDELLAVEAASRARAGPRRGRARDSTAPAP